MATTRKKVRVIHLVENLNGQAVETWLLRVLRASSREYSEVHWTFFCVLGERGKFDETARKLGAEVIHSPHPIGHKVAFMRALRRILKAGRYDVLHAHHDIMSAAYLLAAVGLPIRKRIVHLHNTSLSLPTPNAMKVRLIREPMRQVCLRMSDQIVGISRDALESLVGGAVSDHQRQLVVHYAVDTSRFAETHVTRDVVRKRMGITPDAKVLLFVGRLTDYKNPGFLIEILAQQNRNAMALFAGTGNQYESLIELAMQKGVSDRVKLLGFRDDVPDLMQAADVFVWPSLENPKEGLGLGIIEAQAAGLPILMSRSVPDEAVVIPELVDVLPLADGAEAWAKRIDSILARPSMNRSAALSRVEASSFSMAAGVRSLMKLYDE